MFQQKTVNQDGAEMVKIRTLFAYIAGIGFLIAVGSLIILLYNALTDQFAPLVYELSLLIGVFSFLICTGLTIIISNIEGTF